MRGERRAAGPTSARTSRSLRCYEPHSSPSNWRRGTKFDDDAVFQDIAQYCSECCKARSVKYPKWSFGLQSECAFTPMRLGPASLLVAQDGHYTPSEIARRKAIYDKHQLTEHEYPMEQRLRSQALSRVFGKPR
jgi:hypothetical protein